MSKTAATAAIPDANASASPPSSCPSTSSNASQVGFPSRLYDTGPPAWYVDENTTGGLSGASGAVGRTARRDRHGLESVHPGGVVDLDGPDGLTVLALHTPQP